MTRRWLVVRRHPALATEVVARCWTHWGAAVALWRDRSCGLWPEFNHEWEILPRAGGGRRARHAR